MNEDELEAPDAMQGVENTQGGGKSATGVSGNDSVRSQSMSISATASVSGVEVDDDS